MERIKVQQQAHGAIQENAVKTMLRLFRTRGVAGFAVGLVPLMSRNIFIDIIQLPSVDAMRWVMGHA